MEVLQRVVNSHRILVLLGAGGVGKTTSAIVIALAAAKMGKRVALLSIDPAKRLANALGIPLSNNLAELQIPANFAVNGSLHAAMLDQKAVFDQMVQRHAPTPAIAARIMAHQVYKSASTNLGGPLEYMALAKLTDLAADPAFDLVVLDTPPDTHALDFLARPNILGSFMDTNVMNWLLKPFLVASRFGLGKILSAGERLMGGMARVSGLEPLRQFAEFLVLMQDVIQGFHKSGETTAALLRRADTGFIFVSVPTPTARRSVEHLDVQLKTLGYKAVALLLNRCLPEDMAQELLRPGYPDYLESYARKARGQDDVSKHLHSLAPTIWRLHEMEHDPGDLEGLMQLVQSITAAPSKIDTQATHTG